MQNDAESKTKEEKEKMQKALDDLIKEAEQRESQFKENQKQAKDSEERHQEEMQQLKRTYEGQLKQMLAQQNEKLTEVAMQMIHSELKTAVLKSLLVVENQKKQTAVESLQKEKQKSAEGGCILS
jgi:hypothetical protein